MITYYHPRELPQELFDGTGAPLLEVPQRHGFTNLEGMG